MFAASLWKLITFAISALCLASHHPDTMTDKLLDAIKELLISGAHSDFTFTCGTDVHAVHKAIICGRSENFERAVRFKGAVSKIWARV
jgi:hypothetical protein